MPGTPQVLTDVGFLPLCAKANTPTCTQAHAYMHIAHVDMHIHMHTYTPTYTHTCTPTNHVFFSLKDNFPPR